MKKPLSPGIGYRYPMKSNYQLSYEKNLSGQNHDVLITRFPMKKHPPSVFPIRNFMKTGNLLYSLLACARGAAAYPLRKQVPPGTRFLLNL